MLSPLFEMFEHFIFSLDILQENFPIPIFWVGRKHIAI